MQRMISPRYGVWNRFCFRLKALGRRPSMDIAYAQREVPTVPDSSAPVIDNDAPTPTTSTIPAVNRAGEPKVARPAATRGAPDATRAGRPPGPAPTRRVTEETETP